MCVEWRVDLDAIRGSFLGPIWRLFLFWVIIFLHQVVSHGTLDWIETNFHNISVYNNKERSHSNAGLVQHPAALYIVDTLLLVRLECWRRIGEIVRQPKRMALDVYFVCKFDRQLAALPVLECTLHKSDVQKDHDGSQENMTFKIVYG